MRLPVTACLCFTSTLIVATAAAAVTIDVSSPAQRVSLIELYTSEGCSSCPPADRWLSGLTRDARLWRNVVPVAFHVDYWDDLGWRDRFSDARYSARQNEYKKHGYLNVIYTPGLMNNGREWRGWSSDRDAVSVRPEAAGVLRITIDDAGASAEYTPAGSLTAALVLNIAFLGFDLSTDVVAGENGGKQLLHDFVALSFRQYPQTIEGIRHYWRLEDIPDAIPGAASGIAAWITAADDPTPLQATGGWLAR